MSNLKWDDDKPLPEDAAISAAFPTRSDRHDLYAEATRLVGAKHSKHALVALVNWLLHEREKSRGVIRDDALGEAEAICRAEADAYGEGGDCRAVATDCAEAINDLRTK